MKNLTLRVLKKKTKPNKINKQPNKKKQNKNKACQYVVESVQLKKQPPSRTFLKNIQFRHTDAFDNVLYTAAPGVGNLKILKSKYRRQCQSTNPKVQKGNVKI